MKPRIKVVAISGESLILIIAIFSCSEEIDLGTLLLNVRFFFKNKNEGFLTVKSLSLNIANRSSVCQRGSLTYEMLIRLSSVNLTPTITLSPYHHNLVQLISTHTYTGVGGGVVFFYYIIRMPQSCVRVGSTRGSCRIQFFSGGFGPGGGQEKWDPHATLGYRYICLKDRLSV